MTDASLFHLATKPKHQFGTDTFVPAAQTSTRLPQSERTCHLCRLVKVTVHGCDGLAWREWRRPHETAQLADQVRPECVPIAANVEGAP